MFFSKSAATMRQKAHVLSLTKNVSLVTLSLDPIRLHVAWKGAYSRLQSLQDWGQTEISSPSLPPSPVLEY